MLGIDKMSSKQIHELLPYVSYAHVDCIHEGRHYVTSLEYCIADSEIFLFATGAIETKDIDQEPEVCLQAEEFCDPLYWHKVIINGRASRLIDPIDIDQVMHFLEGHNPLLLSTISRAWTSALKHLERIAIYRFHLSNMSGQIIKIERSFAEQECSQKEVSFAQ
jgi:uncharacterized protein